ncbi:hypothetical protein CLV75_0064 [Ruegeria conchae]|uniref:Uncharacterized protein n=1 Tax=Ruegeria conchae TaxID=981384 RepID=A0A497ZP52_9RHOB|nr:hypothetical protein CLV75_0064 [Ruegeria conchae]
MRADQSPTPEHPVRFHLRALAGLPACGCQSSALSDVPPSRHSPVAWAPSPVTVAGAAAFDGKSADAFPFHLLLQTPTLGSWDSITPLVKRVSLNSAYRGKKATSEGRWTA